MTAEKLFEQFVREVARAFAGSVLHQVSIRKVSANGASTQLDARARSARQARPPRKSSSRPAPRTRGSGEAARKKIVQALRRARGKYVAGVDLAKVTKLSLFTVRQHITRLRGDGTRIFGKRGRGESGYRLG